MDIYDIWADLKPGVRDTEFADAIGAWLGMLQREGKIEGWRLMRRKLGFGFEPLGEFHVQIETRDLAQLDEAFKAAASRAEPAETPHFNVNRLVTNFRAALYRDFPDDVRKRGEEKF